MKGLWFNSCMLHWYICYNLDTKLCIFHTWIKMHEQGLRDFVQLSKRKLNLCKRYLNNDVTFRNYTYFRKNWLLSSELVNLIIIGQNFRNIVRIQKELTILWTIWWVMEGGEANWMHIFHKNGIKTERGLYNLSWDRASFFFYIHDIVSLLF